MGTTNVGRAQLTVQPPDVLDCADYQRKMIRHQRPPCIVASYDPVNEGRRRRMPIAVEGRRAVADLYRTCSRGARRVPAGLPGASWRFSSRRRRAVAFRTLMSMLRCCTSGGRRVAGGDDLAVAIQRRLAPFWLFQARYSFQAQAS